LSDIFNTYGNLRIFIDVPIDKQEDLEKLKNENEFIAKLSLHNLIYSLNSFEHHLKENGSNQILVFTESKREYFDTLKNKAALFFTYENYQNKIKNIVFETQFE